MATGWFCVHNGDGVTWIVCTQYAVVTRTPRQLLTVDMYESATPTQKSAYDVSLAGVNAVYSLVNETEPEEED